eukprot:Rhum_TRINITY_DN14316_c6_g2::Rhum_TRINITY_DN14316_c6_g2_i1::g.82378::m.82378
MMLRGFARCAAGAPAGTAPPRLDRRDRAVAVLTPDACAVGPVLPDLRTAPAPKTDENIDGGDAVAPREFAAADAAVDGGCCSPAATPPVRLLLLLLAAAAAPDRATTKASRSLARLALKRRRSLTGDVRRAASSGGDGDRASSPELPGLDVIGVKSCASSGSGRETRPCLAFGDAGPVSSPLVVDATDSYPSVCAAPDSGESNPRPMLPTPPPPPPTLGLARRLGAGTAIAVVAAASLARRGEVAQEVDAVRQIRLAAAAARDGEGLRDRGACVALPRGVASAAAASPGTAAAGDARRGAGDGAGRRRRVGGRRVVVVTADDDAVVAAVVVVELRDSNRVAAAAAAAAVM